MKKTLKILIVSLVVSFALYLGVRIFQKLERQKAVDTAVMRFQDFCAFDLKGKKEICTDTLTNKPILLLFVHPECDFCHEEIVQIIALRERLENIVLILITHAEKDQAIDFYVDYDLSRFSHLHFLVDDYLNASVLYGTPPIPSLFLYNAEKKLLYKRNSAIKIEMILDYLPK